MNPPIFVPPHAPHTQNPTTFIPPAAPLPPPPPPLPKPPRVWPIFVAFVSIIALQLAVGVALVVVAMIVHSAMGGGRVEPDSVSDLVVRPVVFVPLVLASSLAILGGAVVPAWLSRTPLPARLGLARSSLPMWTLPLVLLAGPAVGNLFEELMRITGGHSSALANFQHVFGNASPMQALVYLFPVALVGPISEEMFFRGYAQTRLTARWGPWVGVAVASVLFGIIHLDPWHSLFAAAFGAYLGVLSVRAGSIWPAVWVHMFNNALSTVAAAAGLEFTTPAARAIAAGVSASLIAGAVAVILLSTPRRPEPPAFPVVP